MSLRSLRHDLSEGSVSSYLNVFCKVSTFGLAIMFAIYIAGEYPVCQANWACYDVMALTGCLTLFFGIFWSAEMRWRFLWLVRGLIDSGAIKADSSIPTFERAVTRSVGRWCIAFMIFGAGAVYAAFAASGRAASMPFLCWTSVWAGAVGGERYGRLACYSRGASLITKSGGRLVIDFRHPDNAGGLLPFSNFYLYTMILAAIPSFWLASWWVVIPHLPATFTAAHHYGDWRVPFGAMWIVVTALAAYSFVRPVLTIHREMAAAKTSFLETFRTIPPTLSVLYGELLTPTPATDSDAVVGRIGALQQFYRDASNLTTWPLDKSVVGIFTGINLAQFLVPLWLKAVVGEQPDVSDAIQKLIDKLGGS